MNANTETAARSVEVAASVAEQLGRREAAADLAGVFAADQLQLIADAGLLGLNVPADHGGFGDTLAGTLETLRILANGSPSSALMLAMHTSIIANVLLDEDVVPAAHRAEFRHQRASLFESAMNGKRFAVANSEAGAGGDLRNSRAEVRDGRLYGVKTFCSMGTSADYFAAAARNGSGRVDLYFVENDGNVAAASPWNSLGMRSSESVSLRFDGARVVATLGYPGMLESANNRHWSTLSFTAVIIGTAESLLDEASRGHGILQQTAAVDLHLTLQASRAFLRHCAAIEPRPADDAYRALVRDCKLYATRALALQGAALYTAQTGSAYRFDASMSRMFRDLLAGPALRPPVGATFDALWDEISDSKPAD